MRAMAHILYVPLEGGGSGHEHFVLFSRSSLQALAGALRRRAAAVFVVIVVIVVIVVVDRGRRAVSSGPCALTL